MTFVRACLTASALLTLPAMLATEASALPVAPLQGAIAPGGVDTAQYYGGPRYGYGYRHRRRFFGGRGLSYGTGYHGRGTVTGGPVGGLPNRN